MDLNLKEIIFYDGDCGLCQRSVSFIHSLDSEKKLAFAPLNGETYQALSLPKSDMTTVMFYSQGKLFFKSEAIIQVGWFLGGWKRVFILAKIIPRSLRDLVYDFIAKHRKKVSCIILPRDQRFLK